jgi:hypothetical protein
MNIETMNKGQTPRVPHQPKNILTHLMNTELGVKSKMPPDFAYMLDIPTITITPPTQ